MKILEGDPIKTQYGNIWGEVWVVHLLHSIDSIESRSQLVRKRIKKSVIKSLEYASKNSNKLNSQQMQNAVNDLCILLAFDIIEGRAKLEEDDEFEVN